MKAVQSSPHETFRLVDGMEDDLTRARDMANALCLLAPSLEPGPREAVWIMADTISRDIAAAEEKQTKLFRITNEAAFGLPLNLAERRALMTRGA